MSIRKITKGETKQLLANETFIINNMKFRLSDANIYALLVLERRIDAAYTLSLPLNDGNLLLALKNKLLLRIKQAKSEILESGKGLPVAATVSARQRSVDLSQLTRDATRVATNRQLIASMGKSNPSGRNAHAGKRVCHFVCACGKAFYRPHYRVNSKNRAGQAYCSPSCRSKYSKVKPSTYCGQGYLNGSSEFVKIEVFV